MRNRQSYRLGQRMLQEAERTSIGAAHGRPSAR